MSGNLAGEVTDHVVSEKSSCMLDYTSINMARWNYGNLSCGLEATSLEVRCQV